MVCGSLQCDWNQTLVLSSKVRRPVNDVRMCRYICVCVYIEEFNFILAVYLVLRSAQNRVKGGFFFKQNDLGFLGYSPMTKGWGFLEFLDTELQIFTLCYLELVGFSVVTPGVTNHPFSIWRGWDQSMLVYQGPTPPPSNTLLSLYTTVWLQRTGVLKMLAVAGPTGLITAQRSIHDPSMFSISPITDSQPLSVQSEILTNTNRTMHVPQSTISIRRRNVYL